MTDTNKNQPPQAIDEQLDYLKLPFIRENYDAIATEAAQDNWTHARYLSTLITAEAKMRYDRSIQRKISLSRFPQIKTLDQFLWTWPKKINRQHIQNLFRLKFIESNTNVIFLGGVGLGKTHLAIALGYTACLKAHSVLFTTAVDVINHLAADQAAGNLKNGLKKYLKPRLLILDELGYLPIDKNGADLLFQIISYRYEKNPTIITSNRAYKDWPEIFNNDSTLTSALLDRTLHHAETAVIEGDSYRMKDIVKG